MNNNVKHLLDPELDKRAEQMIAEARQRDDAGDLASRAPFPGAAREAFAVDADATVCGYTVRDACDYDLVLLEQAKNSFYKFFLSGADEDLPMPSGPDAWLFCFIMTRDAKTVVRPLVKEKGIEGLKAAAEEEFSMKRTGDLVAVAVAGALKVAQSISTTQKHKSPDAKEVATSSLPPSGPQLTVLGGS